MARGLDYLINLRDGDLSGAGRARNELQGLDAAVENTGGNFENLGATAQAVGGLIAGALAIDGIKTLADDLIEVRGQFQGFENLLKNSLGEAGGAAIFSEIKTFAKETPFEVDQLTESFIKLQGSGFNPTIEKMEAIGDIAAAKMKSVDQFSEAIIDAQTGEFERLKEFGIRASKSGEDVTFTYNGISKTMKFSQRATEDYLLSLGKLPGIYGSMDAMANTFIGKQSNVDDMLTQFKDRLGKDLEPVLSTYLELQGQGIELMQSSVDWFKANIEVIGVVTEAVVAMGGAYLLYRGYILATQAPMMIMTAAQWALNAAMTANPVGLIVAGIGLLIGGLTIAYRKSETFRAVIDGIIEVGKIVMDVFTGVGKVILGAFTFNPDMFIAGVNDSIEVAKKIADGGIGKAFNKGFDESKAKSKADAAAEAKKSAMDQLATKPGAISVGKGSKSIGAGSGSASTTVSTNKQVRNVQVTIGKLVENLTVATTNLQGAGSADIKRIITEILTGAVHDSELALSSE